MCKLYSSKILLVKNTIALERTRSRYSAIAHSTVGDNNESMCLICEIQTSTHKRQLINQVKITTSTILLMLLFDSRVSRRMDIKSETTVRSILKIISDVLWKLKILRKSRKKSLLRFK